LHRIDIILLNFSFTRDCYININDSILEIKISRMIGGLKTPKSATLNPAGDLPASVVLTNATSDKVTGPNECE
jgi:hypothetical protein